MDPGRSRPEFIPYLREIERLRMTAGASGAENLVVLERVESTNGLARLLLTEYDNEGLDLRPVLILAFEQTGGRGRLGRQWSSPRGLGVYATRVLIVDDPERLQTLPLLVGIGLCRALERLGVSCRLKWPNDVLVQAGETGRERRKIGGILIEALVHPGEGAAAIIGFGVNQGQTADELPAGATSLRLERPAADRMGEAELATLTWELVAGVERELSHLGDVAYAVEAYRQWSVHRPGERLACRVGDKVVAGTFAGFDETGRLILDTADGEVRMSSGEVVVES